MNIASLLRIYKVGLLVILFGILLHAPLSVGFGALLPDWTLLFKIWKEIILFILLITALVIVSLKHLWLQLLRDRLIQLSIAYSALHLLLLPVFWQGLLPSVAGLMIDLRFIIFFVLCYVAVKMDPVFIKTMVKTLALGAVVVVGFGVLQVAILPDDVLAGIGYNSETIRPFTTIDSNTDFIRINSTLRGPNPLGATAVVFMALLVAYGAAHRSQLKRKQWYVLLFALIAVIAVLFATFSRSAYLAALTAAAILAVLSLARNVSWKWWASGGVAVAVAIAGWIGLVQTDWYSNVILHEDPESTVVSKSNDEHVRSLGLGTQRLFTQPFGAGIGSTGSASLYDDDDGQIIENYYLFVGHETGWIGFVLFVVLSVGVLVRLWRYRDNWLARAMFASGIGLVVIGLLLPVWSDETVALVWWGLAGGIIGGGYEKRARKQKATRAS